MAKARVIIKRRKAVRNIRKITKVMQMIATARYQKAFRRAVGTKPYVAKIGELVAHVAQSLRAGGGKIDHPLLQERSVDQPRYAVLVLTSNRGLCGGYNGNILRLSQTVLKSLSLDSKTQQPKAPERQPELHVVGKKGLSFYRFLKQPIASSYATLSDPVRYADIEAIAEQFIADYVAGRIDGLRVVYMKFISAGQQKPTAVDILPLSGVSSLEETAEGSGVKIDFSPEPVKMLEELIPITVKVSLFQAFVEASVSEQIARMVAMKSATDNADKMVRKLTQDYNRARQSQITKELSELMGGVEAIK